MKLRLLFVAALIGSSLIAMRAFAATPPAPFLPASPAPAASPPAAPAASQNAPPAVGATSAPPAPDARAPAAQASPLAHPASVAGPVKRKPKKAAAPPRPLETALPADPRPTVQPNTFFATAKAAERYGAIAEMGGWPTDIAPLKLGSKGPAVAELRKRLAIEGDLARARAYSPAWDPDLTAAVKRFQGRVGLRPTGIVAGATLKAMNVPARVRFNQLQASANRLSALNFPFGDRYVVVNLPSLSVEAVDNGVVARRYVAIVGDPAHPSPEIAAQIQVVNLNPKWTVPVSIIKKEIIPRMQRDPGYLTRERIRILDNAGREVDPRSINWSTQRAANYTLRQDSGAGNSLGSIRIGMPNKLAVYMHDTPSKRLFGADYRFLSHGCVRVQGVYDLAAWVLQGVPVSGAPSPASTDPLLANAAATIGAPPPTAGGAWNGQLIQQRIATGAREDIKLPKPVPVIWVYMTGWASADGTVHF